MTVLRHVVAPEGAPAGRGYPVVAAANRKDDHHELVQVTAADASRAADLIEQYSDLPLGTANAIVVAVAVAERFRAANVATLDRRHFSVVRPSHVAAFTLLP